MACGWSLKMSGSLVQFPLPLFIWILSLVKEPAKQGNSLLFRNTIIN